MRSVLILALSFLAAGCAPGTPKAATNGPRLSALLAATWPAAAPARQVTFSRDGKLLATSDASGLLTIRETGSWKVVRQFRHPGGATSLAFGKDGSQLFSGGYDGTIRLWHLTGRGGGSLSRQRGTVWTLDISPDGKKLAAAGEDTVIRIFDLVKGGPPAEFRGHERNVWHVRFSPDGRRLASGSFDNSARLWDVSTGQLLKTLAGHTQAIVGLDFSPDGKLLATGADDSTIRLWNASDGTPLRTIDNGTHVDAVAFSPDGLWLASGGHPHGALGEIWHQVTGGGGNGPAVRLWRRGDAALVAELLQPEDVISLAFSRDGHWLVTSGEDSRFRLWRLRPET